MPSIRKSPSGEKILVAGRQAQLRQNPNAPQIIIAPAAAIVLQQTISLGPGQGVLIEAIAAGLNVGVAPGVMVAEVQASAGGPPIVLRAGSAQPIPIGGAGRAVVAAGFIPADPSVASTVTIDLVVRSVAETFDVGSQPDGGCSLLCTVAELDGSFQLVTATP
jgi:hypothetical protein